MHSNKLISFLHCRAQNCPPALEVRLSQHRAEWKNMPSYWQAMPDAPQHTAGPPACPDTLNLPSTRTFRYISTALLSSISPPNLYGHPGMPHSRYRIWHLSLLNIKQLLIAQASNLSRSLYRISQLSRESTATANLELSENLLSISSSLSSSPGRSASR